MEPLVEVSAFAAGPGWVATASVLAVALRYGEGTSLMGYLQARGGEEDPAWWPAFARGFRRYASRESRELSHRAVMRQGSRSSVLDGGRVARRSVDVMTGGRS